MSAASNPKIQFRVLYHQFLFRVADLEILSSSALGDSSKLLGQFAALLIVISVVASFGAFGMDSNLPPAARLAQKLMMSHFLIATTMLVAGIFTVLSWDSIFPDRRDIMVLGPLPVRARTMFRAKVAASATALFLVVAVLNCATGLAWPFALANPFSLLAILRSFAAYWFTMLAAGAFIYGSVLAIQGVAAQILPRRFFLRVSSILQMAAFCILISTYFLEPPVDSLEMLAAPQNHRLLLSIPSYWFLGLFHQLNGSLLPPLAPLAARAWFALAITGLAAFVAYALSYIRTMRQILEEPDIAPGPRGIRWLPRFGGNIQTAIGQFCLRSISRSRQHRLILAFYLGVALAFTILLLPFLSATPESPSSSALDLLRQPNTPVLASSLMILVLSIIGARVAFAFPLDLRANWIFRAVGLREVGQVHAAVRRVLLMLAVLPVWLMAAAVCFQFWPWRLAAAHLLILGSLVVILADVALYGFRKIPFTCSYLPGKSQVHMIVSEAVVLIAIVAQAVISELQALRHPLWLVAVIAFLALAAVALHWHVTWLARTDQEGLQFEEESPAVLELGLYRDGAALGSSNSSRP